MLKKLVPVGVMSLLLVASTSLVNAASSPDLAAGQMCATRLYIAAHGQSPSILMRKSRQLVDFDHVMRTAAAINGDTLTPSKKAAYKKGMDEFAKHTMPQLTAKLRSLPKITAVTSAGNILTISDGSDVALMVQKSSCRIVDARSAMMGTLTGNVAKFIKDNNFS